MKNYTSLGSSPNTNYIRFNDNGAAAGDGGPGGLGGLGGLGDNLAFKRFEKYDTHEAQQKREINQNSNEINGNKNIYTTENIIQHNSNNNNNNNNNSNTIIDNKSFISVEVVYRTIVIPFYICLMDIIILNNLYVEIVDNGNIEIKNKVLGSGKIRKYHLNGAIKNYDIFVEMENENVFHVKRRGIMMRVRVSEDVRKLIINTMVNYVADGGDVDAKTKVVGGINSDHGGQAGSKSIISVRNRTRGGGFAWFRCFKSHPD